MIKILLVTSKKDLSSFPQAGSYTAAKCKRRSSEKLFHELLVVVAIADPEKKRNLLSWGLGTYIL